MNFALLLFVLLVITLAFWLLDWLVLAPRRRRAADAAVQRFERDQASRGAPLDEASSRAIWQRNAQPPWWIEYTAGLMPVIALVFVLRSFVAEPFKIPSGSMLPTLLVGDLILVNKYAYGIRLPIINTKVVALGDPQRGDVMVFRYPKDPSVDYIKRVVGIPGDTVAIENNQLSVNGQVVERQAMGQFYDSDKLVYADQYLEKFGANEHKILTDQGKASFITPMSPFPHEDLCHYSQGGVSCKVPPGNYFMMGDNRDNSLDSRFWGFVPDENIVGKAFFIWMNLNFHLSRIGRFN